MVNAAEVTIHENGVGMMDEIIFNLFRIKLSKSLPATEGETGTGLGLVLTKNLLSKTVELKKCKTGCIKVHRSHLFYLYRIEMNKKVKVLVVEDENIVGIDLKRTLKKLNYQVLDVVRTGEDAVRVAIENKPDIILMDIMLSGKINGIEAIKKIKEEIDFPVIYLTAYGDEQTIQDAKLTNPFGYILKPFDERTLHYLHRDGTVQA